AHARHDLGARETVIGPAGLEAEQIGPVLLRDPIEDVDERRGRHAVPARGSAGSAWFGSIPHGSGYTRGMIPESVDQKPGNDFATQSGSAIETPGITSPATAKAIAILWSP